MKLNVITIFKQPGQLLQHHPTLFGTERRGNEFGAITGADLIGLLRGPVGSSSRFPPPPPQKRLFSCF